MCTVCIWHCEHARFCVDVFYVLYLNFHSFIHSIHLQTLNITFLCRLNFLYSFKEANTMDHKLPGLYKNVSSTTVGCILLEQNRFIHSEYAVKFKALDVI